MGRNRDRSYSRSPSRSMSRSRSRSRSVSLLSTSSGRAAKARNWNGEGGHRLHLSDLAIGVSRHAIEKLFQTYGPLNEVWVASNPPCFAFINFHYRNDAEQALRELDGKVVGGSRIGLSWARPRNYGGRSVHSLRYRSRSPSYRRSYGNSYRNRRSNDRYNKHRYSRSRSRSSNYRRQSPSSRSRSRSRTPRDDDRTKRKKTSKQVDKRRRSYSKSNSYDSDHGSSYKENGRKAKPNQFDRGTPLNNDNYNHVELAQQD